MLRACRSSSRKGGHNRRRNACTRRALLLAVVWSSLTAAPAHSLGAQPTPPAPGPRVIPRARLLRADFPADSFVASLAGAGFRFAGTVLRHGRTPAEFAQHGPFATLVRVDTVFRAPPSVGDLRRQRLTILVPDTVALPATRPAVFLAAGVSFGDDIVLRSQGHVPLDTIVRAAVLGEIIARADTLLRIATVRGRASGADAVFVGTVLGIADSAASASTLARRGEHDPRWRQAEVRVDSYYGPSALPTGTTVRVLFPGSSDMAYRFSPRLQAGGQSLFFASNAYRLLRDTLATSALPRTFFVVRPLDVVPASDSILVRPAIPPP